MANWTGGKRYGGSDIKTGIDAGYGLIFRLNFLWCKADQKALDGDFDGWNYLLDRIYCNLTYRYQLEVLEDDNGDIKDIKLSERDEKIYRKISDDITKIKIDKNLALKKREKSKYHQLHEKHYELLMLKDIWTRKYMHGLGLYLKEIERNPSNALFGGG